MLLERSTTGYANLIACCLLAVGMISAVATRADAANAAEASPGADEVRPEVRLDVWEFVVDGNSVLDAIAIEEALMPFLGPARTVEDIDKAREALESVYRERGYRTVAVSIPAQSGADGIVQLTVEEARVGHLTVVGSKYHSIDVIREAAPGFAEGTVPDFEAVQQDLVRLNQQADRRVTPAMRAGKKPGTVDVDLMVEDSLPLHGWLELNNRYSLDTSEQRVIASLSYDNLFQRGHSLSLSFQTAPERTEDAKVFFGTYFMRLDDSPWSILVNALETDSDVATVGGINVLGNGTGLSVFGVRSLEGGDGFYPSVSIGVGYKDFKTSTLLGSGSFETPVTYYPVTLGYSAMLRTDSDQWQFDASMNFASPQLGSDTETIQQNRFAARGQMFYLRGSVSNRHDFEGGAQSYLRLGGQVTDQPLISNEQFSAGGMDSVRGYLEAEALGDYGMSGSLELRSPQLASYLPWAESSFEELRAFAFLDAARLQLKGPFSDGNTPGTADLLSVGAGLSMKLHPWLNGVVDYAYVLEDGPNTDARSDRVLFRVWTSF
jgi:hemolysin activation/secretion protein